MFNARIYVYQHFTKWPAIEWHDDWTDIYILWSVVRIFKSRGKYEQLY